MDIGKALSFPFEDKDWIVKILIGGILMWIPIVNFFVFGYIFKVLQKAAQDGTYELPVWEDWGSLFGQGFFVFLAGLIYFLVPGILYGLGIAFLGGAAVSSFGSGSLVALGILFMALGGIIGFIISLIAPMALALYAATGEFGQIFNFGEIFSRITSNISNYLVAIVIYIGLVIVLGIVRVIPVLGLIIDIFAGFYVAVVMSYLFGIVYRGKDFAPPVAPTI